MISLEKILDSNIEMLKSQEADLLKSLSFVKQAQKLFLAQWGKQGRTSLQRRGRPSAKKATPNVTAAPKKNGKKRGPKPSAGRKGKRVSHLSNIMNVLKQNGKPMSSGDLITTLFKKQKEDKNLKHYRLLIYPVLTKAYASKTLIQKDGKIHLPK